MSILLRIQDRDRELQHSRKGYPREVWNIDECDPAHVRIDSNECPDEGGKDEEDINRSEEVILESKLKVRKREVEDEVEDKRKHDHERELTLVRFVKDGAETNRDDRIEHAPHRTEEPAWWCPRGTNESAVPLI